MAGKYPHGITPNLILGGHCWAIENPAPLTDRDIAASDELRAALNDLTNEKDYRLWFDPYWARVHPYRVNVKPGETATAEVVVRHFLEVPTVYEIKLVCPPGIRIDPSVVPLRAESGGIRGLPLPRRPRRMPP